MRFEWDEGKNESNLNKHGLTFEEASLVFDDPYVVYVPDPYPFEDRWRAFGVVQNVLLVMVVHTQRFETDEEIFRIISARQATPLEKERYENSYP